MSVCCQQQFKYSDMFSFVCNHVVCIKKPNKTSCFCVCPAAKMICIFIFLYCPMTQWGKIKKSERNDGKTNSELLEAGAFVHACIEFQMQRHTCAKYVHRPNNLNV